MTMSSPHARRLVAASFLFAALGMLACEGDPPTSQNLQIRAAKGGGGKPVKVTKAIPAEGEQGATGLVVRVLGSGFDDGSEVAFHLSGDPVPDPKVKNQGPTTFVSESELQVTIDIVVDAEVAKRDVVVTAFRGRRGIGTEKFEVKQTGGKTNDCGFTPLRITFGDADGDAGDALQSDNGTPYEEGTDGGVHLNGATGRLMLWTSQYGDPPRDVEVMTEHFTGPTTDRIYTNGHLNEALEDLDCGFLQMENGSTGSAVLEAELDAEGIVRWGKDCDGNPVDDAINKRVTTTRIDQSTWTVEGLIGVICKKGPKVRGNRPLTIGAAGPFFMTLEKI